MAHIDARLANTDITMQSPSGIDSQTAVAAFETRLQTLEQNMQQQQSQQMQHQQQVAQQFQHMQKKMDSQAQSFHSHLDQRMTEQLSQIEMLLSKKARTE